MLDQFKNFMIGIFVIAATAIIIFVLMFLHPRVGNEGKILNVRFTDIDKVTIGTRVTYGGRPVGEVTEIKEVEFGREGAADSSGHMYLYELTLRVDTNVKVFNSDEISLRTSGLLGEKNVEITPLAPKKGEDLVIIDKEVIFAVETGSVEETFKDIKAVASRFDVALDTLTDILNRIRDKRLIDKLTNTVENIESITDALNKPREWSEILANIHKISDHANKTFDIVDDTLHSINDAGVGIRDAANSARNFMVDSNKVVVKINSGEGTFGKLIYNDDFYLRTNSILSKAETIMDDINHYGLLFSSDKGWQRLRARRMNLMQKLRTPQEFRNYFNDEVDQISTSLSRVYMVLNDLGCDPYCCDIMNDRDFSKVFSELMRRVVMLEEEIKMYNIQLNEPRIHETELGCPEMCQ